MKFIGLVVDVLKSAGEAVNQVLTRKWLEKWIELKGLRPDRLQDFYDQNNTDSNDKAVFRALAIAAMALPQGHDLLADDERAYMCLKKIRRGSLLFCRVC